ncbi:MAG: hypothetical protein HYV65_01040 [Candidatus Spechtbacteria bacterium]|nr:hypothetical protein [Candidatus Spechtbacteria bacterium]
MNTLLGKRILRIANRFSYFFANFGGRIFVAGIVASVMAGLIIMYIFAYRITKESYQADVQFTNVNVSSLHKVLERLDSQKNRQVDLGVRDPFK